MTNPTAPAGYNTIEVPASYVVDMLEKVNLKLAKKLRANDPKLSELLAQVIALKVMIRECQLQLAHIEEHVGMKTTDILISDNPDPAGASH